jgi:TonB family protein
MKIKIIALFFVVSQFCLSQVVTKKYVLNAKGSVRIEYEALVSDSLFKDGKYSYYFQGHKQKEGLYKNNRRDGEWFFSSFKGQKILGQYIDDIQVGKWSYYQNENLKTECYYQNGIVDSVKTYYDNGRIAVDDNKVLGNTYWYDLKGNLTRENIKDMDGFTHKKEFDSNGNLQFYLIYKDDYPFSLEKNISNINENGFEVLGDLKNGNGKCIIQTSTVENNIHESVNEMTFKDGLPNGNYYLHFNYGKEIYKGQLENGFLVGDWLLEKDDNGIKTQSIKIYSLADSLKTDSLCGALEPFFMNVDVMPAFPKGVNGLLQYISKSIHYPKESEKAGLQETVYVSFSINKIGEVDKIKVLRGEYPQLVAEAVRVIQSMPLWSPGYQNSIPVTVKYTLPIKFALQ